MKSSFTRSFSTVAAILLVALTADGGSTLFNKLLVTGFYIRRTGMNWTVALRILKQANH